jgi:chemotaxis response regulator CheB
MFNSLANSEVLDAIVVVLNDTGRNGAAGMFSLHHKGAYTLV